MTTILVQPMQWGNIPYMGAPDLITFSDDDSKCFRKIRDILKRHNPLECFGAFPTHKHFDVADDEEMTECTDHDGRMLTTAPSKTADIAPDVSIPTNGIFTETDEISAACCTCAQQPRAIRAFTRDDRYRSRSEHWREEAEHSAPGQAGECHQPTSCSRANLSTKLGLRTNPTKSSVRRYPMHITSEGRVGRFFIGRTSSQDTGDVARGSRRRFLFGTAAALLVFGCALCAAPGHAGTFDDLKQGLTQSLSDAAKRNLDAALGNTPAGGSTQVPASNAAGTPAQSQASAGCAKRRLSGGSNKEFRMWNGFMIMDVVNDCDGDLTLMTYQNYKASKELCIASYVPAHTVMNSKPVARLCSTRMPLPKSSPYTVPCSCTDGTNIELTTMPQAN